MTVVARLPRVLLAVTLSAAWLLLSGLPASGAVTGAAVERPASGATLDQATPLVVVVERTTSPTEEEHKVQTRLLYGTTAGQDGEVPQDGDAAQQPTPVSDKVVELKLQERVQQPGGDRLRFGGVIDPFNLAWLPGGGVAPNGAYTLQFRVTGGMGNPERPWQDFHFRIDAAPPAPPAPVVTVVDADAKKLAVAWQRNPAPDLASYKLERRVGDVRWKVVAENIDPATTNLTEVVTVYGSYRYRVTAIRPAGDSSDGVRTAVSLPSSTVELQPTATPGPGPTDDGGPPSGNGVGGGRGSGSNSGSGLPSLSGASPSPSGGPRVGPPPGFDGTYRGPLDYGVEPREVTERVPVDVARGSDDSTLTIMDRSIDQQRVLPPLAGGLILVLSAAHVLRYLNE